MLVLHSVQSERVADFHQESMSAYVPIPSKPTFCGLPPPLSPTETLAERDPLAKGVNVTEMKQLSPAGTVLPLVLVSAKSCAFVPVMEMPVMFTATLPLLLSVTLCGRLLVPTGMALFSPRNKMQEGLVQFSPSTTFESESPLFFQSSFTPPLNQPRRPKETLQHSEVTPNVVGTSARITV